MIKLVVFDLWNTLAYKDVDNPPLYEIKEKLRVDIPDEEFVKIFEKSTQTKVWKSKKEAYSNFCENLGIEANKENVNLVMSIRDKAERKIKSFEYTDPLLKQLKSKGYETGIASNSTCFIVEETKKDTNIFQYIDYPLFSFDVEVIKPNTKIFYKLLELSGYKANEVVMIGDNYYDDVLPPKEIGIHSIHFKNYEQLNEDLSKLGVFLN